jgi:hypothetical protein
MAITPDNRYGFALINYAKWREGIVPYILSIKLRLRAVKANAGANAADQPALIN